MKNEFITRDIGEASALLTNGCAMKIQWKDKTAYFIFADTTAQSLSDAYYFGKLQVSAKEYHDNLRMIKIKLSTQNGQTRRIVVKR